MELKHIYFDHHRLYSDAFHHITEELAKSIAIFGSEEAGCISVAYLGAIRLPDRFKKVELPDYTEISGDPIMNTYFAVDWAMIDKDKIEERDGKTHHCGKRLFSIMLLLRPSDDGIPHYVITVKLQNPPHAQFRIIIDGNDWVFGSYYGEFTKEEFQNDQLCQYVMNVVKSSMDKYTKNCTKCNSVSFGNQGGSQND